MPTTRASETKRGELDLNAKTIKYLRRQLHLGKNEGRPTQGIDDQLAWYKVLQTLLVRGFKVTCVQLMATDGPRPLWLCSDQERIVGLLQHTSTWADDWVHGLHQGLGGLLVVCTENVTTNDFG